MATGELLDYRAIVDCRQFTLIFANLSLVFKHLVNSEVVQDAGRFVFVIWVKDQRLYYPLLEEWTR